MCASLSRLLAALALLTLGWLASGMAPSAAQNAGECSGHSLGIYNAKLLADRRGCFEPVRQRRMGACHHTKV